MNDQERYQRARAKVERLRAFYIHAIVYVVVNAGLVGINLASSPGGFWFIWPMLGWGIGLGAHAIAVFAADGFLGSGWEQRQIDRELTRDRE